MSSRALTAVLAFVAACGGAKPAAPPSVPRPQKLTAPLALDAAAPGAVYLTLFAAHLQPNWAQFLEDCRLRLSPTHPLNDMTLVVVAEIAIDRAGAVTLGTVGASGNVDFDRAVRDVMADVHRVEPPPTDLLGDDDRLHLAWTFARDGRQAGPSSARMIPVRQNVVDVTKRLLTQRELSRAARRIAMAPGDADRDAAARLVSLAVLGEALGGSVDVRIAAIDAIDDANLTDLAEPLRALLDTANDTRVRLSIIQALGDLGNHAAVDQLFARLPTDLATDEALALADIDALELLDTSPRTSAVVRDALLTTGAKWQAAPRANADAFIIALHAHARASSTDLDAKFQQWFARGTPYVRAAVCDAQPMSASTRMSDLIARGLGDADATVRATCAQAAARQLGPTTSDRSRTASDARLELQLHKLVRDRDQHVRARALATLVAARVPGFAKRDNPERAAADAAMFSDAAKDASAEVRAVALRALPAQELAPFLDDPDPAIRSSALASLGSDGRAQATRMAKDPDARVRRAAILVTNDQALLAQLAASDSSDVATDALIKLAQLRGRDASTPDLMLAIANAPVASAERVRVALAWLLAATPPP